MLEEVKARLAHFGYATTETDDIILPFTVQKAENHVKSFCNVDDVPDVHLNIAVDMVVGEFFLTKKNSGQDIGIDVESAVAAIQEGDTKVDFAIGKGSLTPEQRLDRLIEYLINGREADLISSRCIRW